MTSRKSLVHPVINELRGSVASPLRRRSLAIQRREPDNFGKNDDEAERERRRSSIHDQQSPMSPISPNGNRRISVFGHFSRLSQEQIQEEISQCLKLNAENKITIKNAFALKLIDLMNYKAKKFDPDKDSFQVASTSLDASTKIYGFRVDAVYNDVLKMDVEMENQEKESQKRKRQNSEGDNGANGENENGEAEVAPKPKRKKSNKPILTNADSLKGNIQTKNLATVTIDDLDSNRSDLLLLATLPHHAGIDPYLNLNNDVIPDRVDPSVKLPSNPVECPKIEKFDNTKMCSSFANFTFLDWSPDDEPVENPDDSFVMENDMQVNLDASQAINDGNHTFGDDNFNVMDDDNRTFGVDSCDLIDTERTVNVARCQGNPREATVTCDFREVVQNPLFTGVTDYTYFQASLDIQWAGPSHWKIRDSLKNRHANVPVVEGCRREPLKRKKDVLLKYNDEIRVLAEQNFTQASAGRNRLQTKTIRKWLEEKITLPNDTDYDVSDFNNLFLKPRVSIDLSFYVDANRIPEEPVNNSINESNDDFAGDAGCADDRSFDDVPPTCDEEMQPSMTPTQAFTDDNLVEAPKISSKINIQFAIRAKKIDVRQLKKAIWKQMTSENLNEISSRSSEESDNGGKVQGIKSFRTIYKNLPKLLSKENATALSVATTFMSVLHLANEKTLKIIKNNNNGDLEIRQDR